MQSESEPSPPSLDWVDTPLRSLTRLAGPMVISMLSVSLMTLVDTLFVSRLGSAALAGVGLGGLLSFTLLCFPMGLLGAVKILASQAVGAGRRDQLQAYLGAGLCIGFGLGLLALLTAYALLGQLSHLTATPEMSDAATDYLRIVMLGGPAVLLRTAVEQTRYAIEDSRSPMRVTVAANILNIFLDYVFIIVLSLGVEGAAWATLVSNGLAFAALLGVQMSDAFRPLEARGHHIAAVLRVGIPSGVQFALELGSYAAMVAMLSRMSEVDGAANQIAIQVIHFGFLPCFAIGEAASVMTGQAVGANRRDLVRVVSRQALLPVLAYSGTMTLVFILLGPYIGFAFTEDPSLLRVTTHLLYIAASFQIADAINIVARSALRGTGDVRYCAWMGILLSWLLTPPLTWLLGYQMGFGAVGGWLGLSASVFASAIVFWRRLSGDGWHAAADRTLDELVGQPR